MTSYRRSDEDQINRIKKLYSERPADCVRIVKKTPDLLTWLLDQYTYTTYVPELIYAALHPDDSGICGNGNKRKFRTITNGWNLCDDRNCSWCHDLTKQRSKKTFMERYGEDNPMKIPEIRSKMIESAKSRNSYESAKEKRKRFYLDNFGVDHNWKTIEGKSKRLSTLNERYGVDNPSLSPELRDRRKRSNLEKYGVSSPLESPLIKGKIKNTIFERYGVINPGQIPEVREKAKNTMLERYGVEHASQNQLILEKQKNTMIERYGVPHPCDIPASKQMMLQTKRERFFEDIPKRTQGLVTPLFTLDDYAGVDHQYQWSCNSCSENFFDTLDDGWIPRCPVCFPITRSTGENELYEFIESIVGKEKLIRNSRSIIPPKEIDIFVPGMNLGFEYNGLYFHSEISGGKDRSYHVSKYISAESIGARLIQIFDHEWLYKRSIVESRIKQLFNISIKIPARKCKIVNIDTEDKIDFLERNHIQGDCVSSHNYGLTFDGELVAVMTFGKSRYSSADYELLRFCSRLGHSVVGGASKLLSYFESIVGKKKLVSYCDLRYSKGEMYYKLGFTLQRRSSPNYWYMHPKKHKLLSRIKYQKHKLHKILEIFDTNLSEWENMKNNGYDRVWDCGNLVFQKNI
jgi:hypothetical protein